MTARAELGWCHYFGSLESIEDIQRKAWMENCGPLRFLAQPQGGQLRACSWSSNLPAVLGAKVSTNMNVWSDSWKLYLIRDADGEVAAIFAPPSTVINPTSLLNQLLGCLKEGGIFPSFGFLIFLPFKPFKPLKTRTCKSNCLYRRN